MSFATAQAGFKAKDIAQNITESARSSDRIRALEKENKILLKAYESIRAEQLRTLNLLRDLRRIAGDYKEMTDLIRKREPKLEQAIKEFLQEKRLEHQRDELQRLRSELN